MLNKISTASYLREKGMKCMKNSSISKKIIYHIVNSVYYGSMSFPLVVISQEFFISLFFSSWKKRQKSLYS